MNVCVLASDFDTEIAWASGGGGRSDIYDAPPWQVTRC